MNEIRTELKNEEYKHISQEKIIWKKIEEFNRYECSDTGKFRYWKDGKYKDCKFRKNYAGYLLVSLYKDGKNKTVLTHRIIAQTFLLNPNNYPVINHIDGNKENNNISNLEWCDYQHNSRHAFQLGLRNDMKGENNHSAKLTFEKVEQIRTKYLCGNYTYLQLFNEYNMAFISVKRIIRNESWYDEKYDNPEYQNNIKILQKKHKRESLRELASKLNWEKIKLIRKLYITGNISARELGSIFGVNKGAICSIIKNETWFDEKYIFLKEIFEEKKKQNFIRKNNVVLQKTISEIKVLCSDGLCQREIGEKLNISQVKVSQILRGENIKKNI